VQGHLGRCKLPPVTTSTYYLSQAARLAWRHRSHLLDRAERTAAAGDAALAASMQQLAAQLDDAARRLEEELAAVWP
jgi:hypothetical protein